MSEDDEDVIIGVLALPEVTTVYGQEVHSHTDETEIRRHTGNRKRPTARCTAGRVLHGVAHCRIARRKRVRLAIAEQLWALRSAGRLGEERRYHSTLIDESTKFD